MLQDVVRTCGEPLTVGVDGFKEFYDVVVGNADNASVGVKLLGDTVLIGFVYGMYISTMLACTIQWIMHFALICVTPHVNTIVV